MSNVRNYLQNARNKQNETYMSFTGQQAFANYSGNNQMVAGVGRKTANATGAASAPQAQPYIITLTNVSATAVSNFDVLGAYTYLQNTGFVNGSLTINGITIASSVPNVTYQQFLYQSMNQPFRVGLTYIQSLAGSAAQITAPFMLNTSDANGNSAQRLIVPTIDPYQQQTNIVAIAQEFSIDGFTKLTFSQILGNASVSIQFYPAANVNLAAALPNGGGNVSQNYGNPNVVAGVPTTIRG